MTVSLPAEAQAWLDSGEPGTKERTLARNPRAAVLCSPREQPYRYLEVRGRVTTTEQGGWELVDVLAEPYTGNRLFPMDGPDEVRVTIRLTPAKVVAT